MGKLKISSSYGEMMTQEARNETWLEGNEEKAILFLLDSFSGMDSTQARKIIHGKMKLVTKDDSSVESVPDDWKPPVESMKTARNEILEICNTTSRCGNFHGVFHYVYWQERVEADYHLRKIMYEFKLDASYIKELSKFRPIRCLRDARELKERYIEFVEHQSKLIFETQNLFSDTPSHKSLEKSNPFSAPHIEEMKADLMSKIATSPDLDEESKIKLIRSTEGITNAMKHGIQIDEDEEYNNDTGWLNPEGIFYGCEYGQHIPLGQKLADTFYPKEQYDHEQRLENHGWAKVGIKEWHFYGKFTKKQIKTIKKWAKIHGDPVSLNGSLYNTSELKDFDYKDPDQELKEYIKKNR
jgi:hypothetical protein